MCWQCSLLASPQKTSHGETNHLSQSKARVTAPQQTPNYKGPSPFVYERIDIDALRATEGDSEREATDQEKELLAIVPVCVHTLPTGRA